MASELFPTSLYNVADFTVVRRTPSVGFADDGASVAVVGPISAIVVPATRQLRLADGEEIRVRAEVYLPAAVAGVGSIKQGDRASWSFGTPSSSGAGEPVVAVEDYALDGLECVRLLIGGGAR